MKKVESIKPTGVLADMIEDFKKDLLLKDLAARIPYGVNVKTPYNDARLIGIIKRKSYNCVDYVDVLTDKQTYPIRYIQPYLRPMSSMTVDEAEEIIDLIYPDNIGIAHILIGDEYIKCKILELVGDDFYITIFYNDLLKLATLDYLNEHMFDYRGLIKEGLASKAPEGMYNV